MINAETVNTHEIRKRKTNDEERPELSWSTGTEPERGSPTDVSSDDEETSDEKTIAQVHHREILLPQASRIQRCK